MNIEDIEKAEYLLRERFATDTFERPGMDELVRMYAVFVLTKGTATTNQDVHHAWVIWARRHDPTNPDIVPYDQLPDAIQAEDSPFMRAIHEVARDMKTPLA